jgi:hypothetical protein
MTSDNYVQPSNLPAFHRAEGVTAAERYLKTLAEHSFLTLWSYAGLYRDQGRGTNGGEGKEVADLLVVFRDHIIIFSDKAVAFPDTGNLDRDWSRWYRRAVADSAKQLWGAERWIKNYPDKIFLDRACTQPFPLKFPVFERAKLHRIIVAHGAAERCRQALGGSGSLMIEPTRIGSAHTLPRDKGGAPFTIGQVDPTKGFVHVLDDNSLDILMKTLDTITDFVRYLAKKEEFILAGRLEWAASEEDLLGLYLKDINEEQEHDFVIDPTAKAVRVEQGSWDFFSRSPERQAQLEADRASYLWDYLIENFTTHFLAGTTEYTSHPHLQDQDRLLSLLAQEPRFHRRMLAKALLDFIAFAPSDSLAVRTRLPFAPGAPYYLFLLCLHQPMILWRSIERLADPTWSPIVKGRN